jgi:hypothetical protein
MRILNVESLARDCKEPVEMRWAESRLECEECGVQQVVRHCKVVRAGPHGTPDIPYRPPCGVSTFVISLPSGCVRRSAISDTVPKT